MTFSGFTMKNVRILVNTLLFVTFLINASAFDVTTCLAQDTSNLNVFRFDPNRNSPKFTLDDCLQSFIEKGYLKNYALYRLFSVSKYDSSKKEGDKLSIALQLTPSLQFKVNQAVQKSRFVIYDYEKESIHDFGFSQPGIYLSNTSDTIVYQTMEGIMPQVIILQRDDKGAITTQKIDNALFPSISNNGVLGYSSLTGTISDSLPMTRLVLRDLKSGIEKTIDNIIPITVSSYEINESPDIGALMPDFSPQGYRLCFVSYTGTKDNIKLRVVETSIYPLGQTHDLFSINEMQHEDIGPMSLFPYYYSGDSILFQSRKTFTGNFYSTDKQKFSSAQSPELIAQNNFERFYFQITSNNVAEWHARIQNSTCFYIEAPGGKLFYTINTGTRQEVKDTGLKPLYFEIWNNYFIYAARKEASDEVSLYAIKMNDLLSGSLDKQINITEKIQKLLEPD
jgi:hypothetical protein